MDPKSQTAAAIALLTPIVDGTRADQLGNATPCRDWDARALVSHIIGGGRMFAAGLRGDSIDAAALGGDLTGGDHRAAYHEAIAQFNAALAQADDLERPVTLPFGTLPTAAALQLAAGDLLVHGWDLAQATDQRFDPPVQFVEASYAFFKMAVTSDLRAAGLFGPAVEVADNEAPLTKLLAHAGRRA